MDYLPTLINAGVIAVVGVLVTWVTRTQIQDLRKEFDAFRHEVRAELRDLRSEVASLRSDLTQVALAVGARARPQTG